MPYKILPTYTDDDNESVSDEHIEKWFQEVISPDHSELVMVSSRVQLDRLRLGLLNDDVAFEEFNHMGRFIKVNKYGNIRPDENVFFNENCNIVEKILLKQIEIKKYK